MDEVILDIPFEYHLHGRAGRRRNDQAFRRRDVVPCAVRRVGAETIRTEAYGNPVVDGEVYSPVQSLQGFHGHLGITLRSWGEFTKTVLETDLSLRNAFTNPFSIPTITRQWLTKPRADEFLTPNAHLMQSDWNDYAERTSLALRDADDLLVIGDEIHSRRSCLAIVKTPNAIGRSVSLSRIRDPYLLDNWNDVQPVRPDHEELVADLEGREPQFCIEEYMRGDGDRTSVRWRHPSFEHTLATVASSILRIVSEASGATGTSGSSHAVERAGIDGYLGETCSPASIEEASFSVRRGLRETMADVWERGASTTDTLGSLTNALVVLNDEIQSYTRRRRLHRDYDLNSVTRAVDMVAARWEQIEQPEREMNSIPVEEADMEAITALSPA